MNNANLENHDFEGFTSRTGLYRVWVPLHDDGKAPLISIWIDPKITAFESQGQEGSVTISDAGKEVAEETEDSRGRCVAVLLNDTR